jgi:hypothetical protein
VTTDHAAEIAAAEAALTAAQAEVDRLRTKPTGELDTARTDAIAEARAEAHRRHPGRANATSDATTHQDDDTGGIDHLRRQPRRAPRPVTAGGASAVAKGHSGPPAYGCRRLGTATTEDC